MRCLAFSEEFKKRKYECFFLSKIKNEDLIKKINSFNVNYEEIKTNDTKNDDIEELLSFTKNNSIDWIITDHYFISSNYLMKLKKGGLNVLSIDDNASIRYYSDLLVNQNSYAEGLDIKHEPYTKCLLGPRYVLLRDELLNRDKKKTRVTVNKILITLGGSSFNRTILKILRILHDTIKEDMEILTILGPLNKSYNDVEKYIKKTKKTVRLINSPKKISDIYLDSDIAISAGGTSCYELAYYGIPNIIITVAENQLNIAKDLTIKNISLYSGDIKYFNNKKIIENIKQLLNNPELRIKMSQNGRELIDGKGKKRIIDFMEKYF